MDSSSQTAENDLSGRSMMVINNSGVSNSANNNHNSVKSVMLSPVAMQNSSSAANQSSRLRVVHQKRSASNNFVQNSVQSVNFHQPSAVTLDSVSQRQQSNIATNVVAESNGEPNNIIQNESRVPNVLSDFELLSSNVQILADRYLMLNQMKGSSFYQCVDIRTGDALICKAIGTGSSYSKILSAYFRLDGNTHIKPLHKLLQTSNQTYLLLPPSQYGDMHSFVREQKRLEETEARQLFRQICQTVQSCHEQGIVLRDLKLRKFVFENSERTQLKFESLEDAVVLSDPEDDVLKEKIGCPAYVAPEILKPNSDFSGKAADLWSLGVILYTMLVGRYPFNDPEHASLFAKISRCQFAIPDFLSSKARCLIKALLQKGPKHRMATQDVLCHPWFQEDSIQTTTSSNPSINFGSVLSSNECDSDDQCVPEIETLDFT